MDENPQYREQVDIPITRILIIENVEDIARSMKIILELSGFSVHIARNGKEAICMILQNTYHFLLLDIALPGQNGFEIANKMEAATGQNLRPRTIIISGYGDKDMRNKIADAGFEYFFLKPADMTEVIKLLFFLRDKMGLVIQTNALQKV